jgi:hypothetical protein
VRRCSDRTDHSLHPAITTAGPDATRVVLDKGADFVVT